MKKFGLILIWLFLSPVYAFGMTALLTEASVLVFFKKPQRPLIGLMATSHPRMQVLALRSPDEINYVIQQLRLDPRVQFAEPNYAVQMVGSENGALPNDANFESQWNLQNRAQPDADKNAGVTGADIHVVPVWNAGVTGNKNVLVATIDSGLDWNHPELAPNLYENPGEAGAKSANGLDDDGNGFIDDVHGFNTLDHNNQTVDDNGHGSHVAGIIGAAGNNAQGVTGINWQVSMLPVKALNAMGAGTLQSVVEGLNYAIKMKAQIINNSWVMSQKSDILEEVMRETEKQGILMVSAAGNSFVNLDGFNLYPASFQFSNTVSVAATNNRDRTWLLSDTGPKTVDVAAPGENILSTFKRGQYKVSSGTSMASPQVAGIAALLKSAHPEWDYKELKKRIIESCVPLVDLRHKVKCQGRVDAWNALQGIKPPNPFIQDRAFQSEPYVAESAHPYGEKLNQYFEIKRPGAKYIRVHLATVELEWDRDHMYLEDPQGNVVEEINGPCSGYSTDYVAGDTLKLRLKTDSSRGFYGFKVDAIEYVP
jgi:subtilisin family serine protease